MRQPMLLLELVHSFPVLLFKLFHESPVPVVEVTPGVLDDGVGIEDLRDLEMVLVY
jgi:hypothetical protein